MNARKALESKLRLLEIELSNQAIDELKARQTQQRLALMLEFTKEQIAMVKSQLARCGE